MSFYTLCQEDDLQVLEPTYKYVDNQTLCLEENADRARSFSLTRPHWREGSVALPANLHSFHVYSQNIKNNFRYKP